MSIVQTLLEQVQTEVQNSGHRGRVVRLHLIIGHLSGVHVEAIRFAFEMLSPDSVAQDAELVIDQPKAVLCCQACQAEHEVDQLHVNCPDCHAAQVTIRGGQELLLQSIELEDG